MKHRIWIALSMCMLLGLVARAGADRLELIRHTNLWDDSPIRSSDASGITYHAPTGHLVIVDSEISEYGDSKDPNGELVFSGYNVFEASLDLQTLYAQRFAPSDSGVKTEPVGIAYNPLDGHMYVTDDDRYKMYRYRYDGGEPFGAPLVTIPMDVFPVYTDPEGIACDQRTGMLYVMSGSQYARVLRYRFDVPRFVPFGEFSVAEHINDPEGIGFDPVSGNLFMVSRDGIAEFTTGGEFVQFFDFSFFGRDISETLPGGLTFAPSSDPNDHPDTYSIYITHRGIDNGKFPRMNTLDGQVSEIRLVREPVLATPIRVPGDYETIQAAIDAAANGDTILVEPGTYDESLVFEGKAVTLVSRHFLDGSPASIAGTVVDGGGRDFAIKMTDSGAGSTISGFTIRNADDGITATGTFTLTHCHITGTSDGIDYEGGGGLVQYCRFTENRDDGIDFDYATAATVEFCDISDNGDDGIEIRLHPYRGDPLNVRVLNNRIERNGEDGIQLIDYDTVSDRTFLFAKNYIVDNAMAGIGCMSSAVTKEDYRGAAIPETVHVFNNTFAGNDHHLTGGANLLAINNIFTGAEVMAVKNTAGASLIARNLFWNNAEDQSGSNVDAETTLSADPLLGAGYIPTPGSSVVDSGVPTITPTCGSVDVVAPSEYRGTAPDLGAWEQ